MPDLPRVAIVGVGGLFPAAPTPEQLWANVLQALDTARPVPVGRWLLPPEVAYAPGGPQPDRVYSVRGYFLDPFQVDSAGLDIAPDLLAQLDPVFHLALHVGRQAWLAAKTEELDKNRVGVILGNIALPTEKSSALARYYLGRTFAERAGWPFPSETEPHPLNRYVAGLPAGVLARALGLGGGSYTLDAACASSLYAIKLAVDELQAGRADAMLAGGISRPDCLYTQMGFSQLRALSPSGRCAPFDARADGLVVGEGAGIFVLKRLSDAVRDGDTIRAVIAGIGLSNDVGGGLLAPNSEGQLRAMRAAYQQAGWSPGDVDMVECHATGTPVGDKVEFQSLRTLWAEGGRSQGTCVIGSVKSTVGHLLTAAGAAAVTKTLFALEAGQLPPSANFETPADGIDLENGPFRILRHAEPWPSRHGQPRRAAVSAFGFGGINAHLLLEEAPESVPVRKPGRTGPSPQLPPIAIVAMSTQFGPWKTLREFQEQVFTGGLTEPGPPSHWWGVEKTAWFRNENRANTPFAGFYLNELVLPGESFRIPPREMQEMLWQQALMLNVAAEALAQAGLVHQENEPRTRTGTFIGVGLDLNTTNFHFRWSILAQGGDKEQADATGPSLSANRTMGALASIAASRIAREFHLGGPSFTIASEESSGLRALEAAVRALQRGELDEALVGAVDLAGDVRAVLASRHHRPCSISGQARPLDRESDGMVVGEGAAAVVLKRLEDAVRDGDIIRGVIRGIGVAGGGHLEGNLPDPKAYQEALRRAYNEADVDPISVDYVETSASGSEEEDRAEAIALTAFFGPRPEDRPLVVGSARGAIGHTGAAAGLAGLVAACLCLDRQVLPAFPSLKQPLSEFSAGFALPRAPLHWLRDRVRGPRRAGVSATSVDGNCVHVVLEAWEPTAATERRDRRQPLGPASEALFVVEAEDRAGLASGLEQLVQFAETEQENGVENLARAWLTRTPRAPTHLAVALVARKEDLARLARVAQELVAEASGGCEPLDSQASGGRQSPVGRNSPKHEDNRGLMTPARLTDFRERIFFSPQPLGILGQVAFVFPGSGNDFPGMGRDLALRWPEVLRRQDAENENLRSQYLSPRFWMGSSTPNVRDRIFAQVALGSLVCDLLAEFGVSPQAAIGYSLGESSALFSLRAWRNRDEMLQRMNRSSLFTHDLTGPAEAARTVWGLRPDEAVDWITGIVERTSQEVQSALVGLDRVYLQIINTPRECVVGGQVGGVKELVRRLNCSLIPVPETTTMHCAVVRPVAEAYRELHRMPTTTAPDLRFYSAALGRAYELNPDSAAEAILAQALDTIDFPGVIEAAYRDGVKLFVEMGPGASCSRMISAILGERPHKARPVCVPGADGPGSVLRMLGLLISERVPVDLTALYGAGTALTEKRAAPVRPVVIPPALPEPRFLSQSQPSGSNPPPPSCAPEQQQRAHAALPDGRPELLRTAAMMNTQIEQAVDTEMARNAAQGAFLRLAESVKGTLQRTLAFQGDLLLLAQGGEGLSFMSQQGTHAPRSPGFLDRDQCLEFAIGSIARVLGSAYAEIDSYPTRVRLPDEPLMLVDRILHVEGEPLSLGGGRVVTEHDIHPGAWYLDCGRIPTCIAVEAGQADLFLSGYLGIDFHTRGLAVYRLLDAAVTFHRSLPGPGEVIHYDIHIDHFFHQGSTKLFRFHFVGTVNGEPLLTMTDGCAGFFSEAELAAGKGVVHTAFQKKPRPGIRPDDPFLPPMSVESYSEQQINALRAGDLAGCFGPLFARLPLQNPLRIPSGRMKLVDRVTKLDPVGGRFGVGLIRAEADIHPDDWFLTCHFVDDQVMPGTLMYECCLHTLRIFLLRLGWVGEEGKVVYEPVLGVTSRLKCRGQVQASTRTVVYEVVIKELGYRPEPYAIVDALMYADGKAIVDITDMSVRLPGTTREEIAALWQGKSTSKPPIFGPESILAFAVGKPSEAFGEPYRVFDQERVIARLPGPPYQFLDRITTINAEPWKMVAGGRIEAQYDVPPHAWYFEADRQPLMPFAVLLEAALQPCGWLAAYLGSALTSSVDLSFRNLGGKARILRPVRPWSGTLTTAVTITRVASSGGMIIQDYAFDLSSDEGIVYQGTTTFGFFTRLALANQVGVREVSLYQPTPEEKERGESFDYPAEAPFPDDRLQMIDRVELLVLDGGPHGLGFVEGTKKVRPEEWFFKAHFYQDPVCPGSLGLESFLQLVKILAVRRCGPNAEVLFETTGEQEWTYRGQVIPTNKVVTVQASISELQPEPDGWLLVADGLLSVDGLVIYRMSGFKLLARCR